MKYVHALTDIPKEPHYVIIEMTRVDIPGDERSRQAPGHGYPARTEYFPCMRVTTDKIEFSNTIRTMLDNDPKREHFVAYHVDSFARTSVQVEITI